MSTPNQHTRTFFVTSIVLLILVAALTLGLAWRQGAFENRLTLRFSTNSGLNLSKGMAVKYQGFRVGQLRSIELMSDGRILGEVEIGEKHRVFATQGSVLRLTQENFVSSELQLQARGDVKQALKEGDEIPFERSAAAADLEKRVMDKIDPVLTDLAKLLSQLGDPKTGVPAAIGALHGTLMQTDKTLEALKAKIADPRMDSVLGNADKVMGNLKTGTEKLGQTLESTDRLLTTADKTVQTLQSTLVTTQQTMQSANKDLSGVMQQSHRLLGDGADLIEDFRQTTLGRWLAPRRAASAAAGDTVK